MAVAKIFSSFLSLGVDGLDGWRYTILQTCGNGPDRPEKQEPQMARAAYATGNRTGLTINPAYEHAFIRNEMLAAKRIEGQEHKQPLTDAQLAEWMSAEFSHVTDSQVGTVEDVGLRRKRYNDGTDWWKDRGPAGEDRPVSREYDADGNVVTHPRIRRRRERPATADGPSVSEARIRELIQDELSQRPDITIVVPERRHKITLPAGSVHRAFDRVLRKVQAGVPVLLVGPTGSGKTYLAGQIAEALGLTFTFNSMSEGVSESALLGRTLPDDQGNWVYRPAPFVTTFRDGGVHLLDEIDAADPNLLVQVNAAIANGLLSIPFADDAAPIRRHKDSVIIAAANTFGHGADRQYVGRNQLDAATLNRFTMGTVEVDYDRDLEQAIAQAILDKDERAAGQLCNWAWGIRDRIGAARLRRFMSTRNIEDCAKLMRAGDTLKDIADTYFAGWTDDEMGRVRS